MGRAMDIDLAGAFAPRCMLGRLPSPQSWPATHAQPHPADSLLVLGLWEQ
jgi:hypothetical protein